MAAKRKTEETPTPAPEIENVPVEETELEKIEAEMRAISPTLPDLKKNNPLKYREVYKHYMWLIGERDRLTK